MFALVVGALAVFDLLGAVVILTVLKNKPISEVTPVVTAPQASALRS